MKIIRCIILLAVIVLFIMFSNLNLNNIENKSENFYKKNSKKVYDILHELLPHIPHFEYVSDIIMLLVTLSVIILDYKLLYEIAGFAITISIIRAFFINATILPKNEICNIKYSSMIRGGCYDKIFSGHFAFTLLSSLILFKNDLINGAIFTMINFINGLFIILSRNHYTIDIIVSIFVVLLVYQNNMNLCELLDKCF